MRALAILRALGPIDAANVRRDPLLRWMIVLPLLFALLFRWLAGLVSPWLTERFGVDPVAYQPLLASFVVLLAPMMYGAVVGFLLLDQKDDGTLIALRVTPLTARGYLAYRIAVPTLLGLLITPVALELSGFSRVGPGAQLLAAAAAAPLGPGFALFIAAFARNKVQGFALMKASGALNWIPVIAWFVTSPWQIAFGLCPTYWPARFYWGLEAGSPEAWIYAVAGIASTTLLIFLLQRRFERIVQS